MGRVRPDSDWRKYKGSLATQKILLDMLVPHRSSIYVVSYPAYIVDEFLVLLGNILQGQTGSHIDDVVQQLPGQSMDPVRRIGEQRLPERTGEVVAVLVPAGYFGIHGHDCPAADHIAAARLAVVLRRAALVVVVVRARRAGGKEIDATGGDPSRRRRLQEIAPSKL